MYMMYSLFLISKQDDRIEAIKGEENSSDLPQDICLCHLDNPNSYEEKWAHLYIDLKKFEFDSEISLIFKIHLCVHLVLILF